MAVIFNPLINDALHKGGLYCRIIRIDKMVLEKCSETTLSLKRIRKNPELYLDKLLNKRGLPYKIAKKDTG